jgi:dienelactone hydrolase
MRHLAAAVLATTLVAPSAALAVATPARATAPAPGVAPAAGIPARLSLPVPTGPYRVGERTWHLVDRGRADPWRPELPYRELMVSLFYPADTTKAGTTKAGTTEAESAYMLPGAAAHFDAVTVNRYLGLGVEAGRVDWARTRTHAVKDAPVAARAGKLPVIVYSPGLGEPRTWSTALVEQLAGAGYLVVTIDSTYESPEVEFPGGRVEVADTPEPTVEWVTRMMEARAADTSFMLDSLRDWAAADLGRVAMFGHSAGGFATAWTMAADRRIRAGANLDGTMAQDPLDDNDLSPVARSGLDRPFLLVGSEGGETVAGTPSWASFWAHSTGWKSAVTIGRTRHASFTDAQVLLPQFQDPATVREKLGTLDPRQSLSTQSRLLTTFFDRFL